jgi:hypothetical protein
MFGWGGNRAVGIHRCHVAGERPRRPGDERRPSGLANAPHLISPKGELMSWSYTPAPNQMTSRTSSMPIWPQLADGDSLGQGGRPSRPSVGKEAAAELPPKLGITLRVGRRP